MTLEQNQVVELKRNNSKKNKKEKKKKKKKKTKTFTMDAIRNAKATITGQQKTQVRTLIH